MYLSHCYVQCLIQLCFVDIAQVLEKMICTELDIHVHVSMRVCTCIIDVAHLYQSL